ncbi:hypothetical protein K503DRAFT_244810, partial [Rhizopogon vinicolor AM-OR11-026]
KNRCFNTSLKVGVVSAFSYPSSTVNTIYWRWFGDTQNNCFHNASDGTFTTAKTLVPGCLDLCDTLTCLANLGIIWILTEKDSTHDELHSP